MDPFAPGRSYGRRSSSGPLDPRHTPGHPLYAPAASGAGGYPSPLPSSFGSSGLGRSSGLTRLPSPGDALRGPDRFERSLELPPLQNIPRSTSPILGRSSRLYHFKHLILHCLPMFALFFLFVQRVNASSGAAHATLAVIPAARQPHV